MKHIIKHYAGFLLIKPINKSSQSQSDLFHHWHLHKSGIFFSWSTQDKQGKLEECPAWKAPAQSCAALQQLELDSSMNSTPPASDSEVNIHCLAHARPATCWQGCSDGHTAWHHAWSPLSPRSLLMVMPLSLCKPGMLLTVAGSSLFLRCERMRCQSWWGVVTLGWPGLGRSTTLPMFLQQFHHTGNIDHPKCLTVADSALPAWSMPAVLRCSFSNVLGVVYLAPKRLKLLFW